MGKFVLKEVATGFKFDLKATNGLLKKSSDFVREFFAFCPFIFRNRHRVALIF